MQSVTEQGAILCRRKYLIHTKEAILPDKVDIDGTHCASKNYPVSPLWIVNSLTHIKGPIRIMHQHYEQTL